MAGLRVLVTGGTSGIGLATAELFARRGDSVIVCGRDLKRIQSARSLLEDAAVLESAQGDKVPIIAVLECDLAQPQQCENLAAETISLLGGLDILVNNAAVAPLSAFSSIAPEDFQQVVAVNLRAPWMLTQKLWTALVESSAAAVVNVSSMAALDPFTGFSLYGASKGWIETWTKALADEGKARGIHVAAVRPGAVDTPLLRRLFPDFPKSQCVDPMEVAEWIVRLATDRRQESGQIVTVAKEPA